MHINSTSRTTIGVLFVAATAFPFLAGCPGTPGGNQAPVAQNQQVDVNAGASIDVTLGATDADSGAVLTFTARSLPAHGALTDASGAAISAVPFELPARGRAVHYAATNGFTGNDSFTFSANDGAADSNTATVSISVGPSEPAADTIIEQDQSVASFSVPAGKITEVRNNAVITVSGDADVAGTLRARGGRIELHVTGDLTVGGVLSARQTGDDEPDGTVPLDAQPVGVFIIVGAGAVTFGSAAAAETDGTLVITDDATILSRTPDDLFNEVEDVSADQLDTLVPLPPDNPAFSAPKAAADRTAEAHAANCAQAKKLQGVVPVTISGVWPPAGAAPPAGDQPVWIFRFNGSRPLNLDNWTVNGPAAPARPAADNTNNPGQNSTGRPGRNGLNLNIWNNGGPINVTGVVTLNLPAGSPGSNATAVCATATGGNGGQAGNFRMTAADGIDISGGTLRINPGASGDGGAATVDPGEAGAAGCPGETGDSATATGGNGADNRKRLFVRGNVDGVENVEIGPLVAGNGGPATAEACAGGEGLPCCDGGDGGEAVAHGGKGGEASLNLGGVGANGTAATVTGGAGGEATATGADGGDGGDCKFLFGGHGGNGGAAFAVGGEGGTATSIGGGGATGGDGGDATATGGNGGAGGDSGFATPGGGGSGGAASATAGTGGAGDTAGAAGTPDQADGNDGPDGEQMEIHIFCFRFAFLVDGSGTLAPGAYDAPVFADEGATQVGTVSIEFRNTPGAQFATSNNPADHFGFSNGQVDVHADSLELTQGTAGVIGGLRITPLYGNGLSENNPLVVQALDAQGEVIDEQSFGSIPNNQANPADAESFYAAFNVDQSVVTFRLIAPPGSFVTILEICLLDP